MASLGILGALGGLGQTATQLGTLSMQSQIEEQRQVAADARAMRLEKYHSEQSRADDQWKLDQADKRAAKDDVETSKIYNDYMDSKYPPAKPTDTTTTLTQEPANDATTPAAQAPSSAPTVNTKYGKLTYDDAIGLATEFTRNRKKDAAKEMIDLAKELKPSADKFVSLPEGAKLINTITKEVIGVGNQKQLSVDEQAIQAYMDAHPGKNAFDAKIALAVAGRTPSQAREIPLDKQAAAAWLRKNPGKDVNDYIDREKPNGDKGERDTTQANTLLSQLKAIHGADEFGNIPKDEANLLAEELPIAKRLRDSGYSIEDAASQAYKDVKDGKRSVRKPITTSKPAPKQSDVRSKADKILGL